MKSDKEIEISGTSDFCTVLECTETSLVCILPARQAGIARLRLRHKLYGYDKSNSFIEYLQTVGTISPIEGGILGGNDVVIQGVGLGNSTSPFVEIRICDQLCTIGSD